MNNEEKAAGWKSVNTVPRLKLRPEMDADSAGGTQGPCGWKGEGAEDTGPIQGRASGDMARTLFFLQ